MINTDPMGFIWFDNNLNLQKHTLEDCISVCRPDKSRRFLQCKLPVNLHGGMHSSHLVNLKMLQRKRMTILEFLHGISGLESQANEQA